MHVGSDAYTRESTAGRHKHGLRCSSTGRARTGIDKQRNARGSCLNQVDPHSVHTYSAQPAHTNLSHATAPVTVLARCVRLRPCPASPRSPYVHGRACRGHRLVSVVRVLRWESSYKKKCRAGPSKHLHCVRVSCGGSRARVRGASSVPCRRSGRSTCSASASSVLPQCHL